MGDRRQIEAQNEDKSHTTKETFEDIKRIHQKEKKKKEKNDAEQQLRRIISEGNFPLSIDGAKDADTFAWDPDVSWMREAAKESGDNGSMDRKKNKEKGKNRSVDAMNNQNIKKNKTKAGASMTKWHGTTTTESGGKP